MSDKVKLIIEIPKYYLEHPQDYTCLAECVRRGTPLPKYKEELKRRLFMEVDGGTDDKYLRYTDVCERISDTIDTYKGEPQESEDKE